ncbi:hypothetical protein [Mycobacterium helveticum]|uniref:hypothetical protein n=1 Tax=Mycobacterium helveticum TaxID=2592811 RepID=UPI00143D4063|nr:hypothetical protein [Mycobacterium helveticum]
MPRLTELASTAPWCTATVDRYGRTDIITIAERSCLWCGAFGDTPAGWCWPANRYHRRL